MQGEKLLEKQLAVMQNNLVRAGKVVTWAHMEKYFSDYFALFEAYIRHLVKNLKRYHWLLFSNRPFQKQLGRLKYIRPQ